jgi:hypothetical protein
VVDPATGRTAGTVVVLANGTATFTPATGFSGQAPPITYMVTSSDGQTSPGTLTVTLQPGAQCACLLAGRGHACCASH